MDLQWQVARRRKCIELGEREGLTFRQLSERVGVCTRTLRRWSAVLRMQRARDPLGEYERRFHERVLQATDPGRAEDDQKSLDQSFVKVLEEPAPAPSANRIEIVLRGGRRLVIEGAVDVQELAQVIATVEEC